MTINKTYFKTIKKFIFYIIIVSITLISCKAQQAILDSGKQVILDSAKPYYSFRGFEPTDPTEYDDEVPIVVGDKVIYKEIKLLTNEQMFSFLNNETVIVSIGQFSAEGGIKYLPITVSAKGASYKITMDYMKSATLPVRDSLDENIVGLRRVGVGLRLISLITTMEEGINIGDLSSIGIAAKTGKLSGTLMIEVIGIKSKDVTTLLPLPSEINQSTIQTAMQALATIKSKIYDSSTKIYPQVMALNDYYKSKAKRKNINQEKETADSIVIANKITLQFGSSKLEKAKKIESQGFDYLFEQNVDEAIRIFNECDKVFPTYNSVYDISNLLRDRRKDLIDKNPEKWAEVYRIILNKYSYKLSGAIMEKLRQKSN